MVSAGSGDDSGQGGSEGPGSENSARQKSAKNADIMGKFDPGGKGGKTLLSGMMDDPSSNTDTGGQGLDGAENQLSGTILRAGPVSAADELMVRLTTLSG